MCVHVKFLHCVFKRYCFLCQAIDSFLSDAQNSLSVRPQTIEEIGQVNSVYNQLAKRKPEVCECMHAHTQSRFNDCLHVFAHVSIQCSPQSRLALE